MEPNVPECSVLLIRLREEGLESPCSLCPVRDGEALPSHWDRKTRSPLGCSIAHTTLSLLEARKLSKHFRNPVERLAQKFDINDGWNVALLSVVLHDIGKLADEYRLEYPNFAHNVLSAVVVHRALEGPVGRAIAYALLLHHEAYHWSDVEKLATVSLLDVLRSSCKVSIKGDIVRFFQESILNLLEAVGLKALRTDLHKVCETLIRLSGQRLEPRYELAAILGNTFLFSLPLYRLIYLADNRAASAREGSSSYWLTKARDVNWFNYREQIKNVSRLFGEPFKYAIALSSLPDDVWENV